MGGPVVTNLGVGVGLRPKHYPTILEHKPPSIDWFEVISENYMESGGRPHHILHQIREHYPVVMHGVSLSIGSTDPLNWDYLKCLRQLIQEIDPAIVSDHLCWTGVNGENLHDLLPLPLTQEALRHVVERVKKVQDFLGRKILLENISTYSAFPHSEMTEWEFIREIAKQADCGILLDINNIYVNAFNHKFDPEEYLQAIDPKYVGQFHLAGHTHKKTYLFDSHIGPIINEVWNLYSSALNRFGPVPTLIEWDENIPEFPELEAEVQRTKSIRTQHNA